MRKICLFGASGHGKVIKEIIESQKKQVIAFIDDNPMTEIVLNVPVSNTTKLKEFIAEKFIISIGNNSLRKKVSQLYELKFTTAIHSKSVVSNSSSIEDGSVIMAGAVINAAVKIGKHCIINTNAVVEHDCKIKDFVHISPSAIIAGNVKIEEGTHVGAGAMVVPSIVIGKWATIGAGAVVIKNVPDYAIVAGNPAKIIKYNGKEIENE